MEHDPLVVNETVKLHSLIEALICCAAQPDSTQTPLIRRPAQPADYSGDAPYQQGEAATVNGHTVPTQLLNKIRVGLFRRNQVLPADIQHHGQARRNIN